MRSFPRLLTCGIGGVVEADRAASGTAAWIARIVRGQWLASCNVPSPAPSDRPGFLAAVLLLAEVSRERSPCVCAPSFCPSRLWASSPCPARPPPPSPTRRGVRTDRSISASSTTISPLMATGWRCRTTVGASRRAWTATGAPIRADSGSGLTTAGTGTPMRISAGPLTTTAAGSMIVTTVGSGSQAPSGLRRGFPGAMATATPAGLRFHLERCGKPASASASAASKSTRTWARATTTSCRTGRSWIAACISASCRRPRTSRSSM